MGTAGLAVVSKAVRPPIVGRGPHRDWVLQSRSIDNLQQYLLCIQRYVWFLDCICWSESQKTFLQPSLSFHPPSGPQPRLISSLRPSVSPSPGTWLARPAAWAGLDAPPIIYSSSRSTYCLRPSRAAACVWPPDAGIRVTVREARRSPRLRLELEVVACQRSSLPSSESRMLCLSLSGPRPAVPKGRSLPRLAQHPSPPVPTLRRLRRRLTPVQTVHLKQRLWRLLSGLHWRRSLRCGRVRPQPDAAFQSITVILVWLPWQRCRMQIDSGLGRPGRPARPAA